MLYKVIHCTGHILANTRPHRLHWGDQVTGRWELLSLKGSQVAGHSVLNIVSHMCNLLPTHSSTEETSPSNRDMSNNCHSNRCIKNTWKCVPLVELCYGQDKMACHLHPILCTWDAVTICTPVTVFFPLGVRLAMLEKEKKKVLPIVEDRTLKRDWEGYEDLLWWQMLWLWARFIALLISYISAPWPHVPV